MMKIQNSRVVIGIAIKVIDETVKSLQINKIIPDYLEWTGEVEVTDNMKLNMKFEFWIDPPCFAMVKENEELVTRLFFTGTSKTRILKDNGEPAFETEPETKPFEISLNTGIALLREDPMKPPFVGIEYKGVHAIKFHLKDAHEHIKNMLISEDIIEIFKKIRIDVLPPVLSTIQEIYFRHHPELDPPAHGSYPVYLKYIKSDNLLNRDAVLVIVNFPIDKEKPVITENIFPSSSEVILYIDPDIIRALLDGVKKEVIDYINNILMHADTGVVCPVLGSLSLGMHKTSLRFFSEILGAGQKVTLKGDIPLSHTPGAPMLFIFPDHITIDLDTPWWLPEFIEKDFEKSLKAFLEPKIETIVGGVLKQLGNSLDLAKQFDFGDFRCMTYPDTYKIDETGLYCHIQMYILPKSDTLVHASWSKMRRKFVLCVTETGRNFSIIDLAGMMADGWITIEGFQQIGRKYIRTIPDGNPDNNMKTLFWKKTN
ncbi:MAG: hypothetical protein JW989_00985 [Chlorobiaceae bacterium]|jgi:hypothetical protein|nr:hypothetical protein [Chlorobiaceae bacterium]